MYTMNKVSNCYRSGILGVVKENGKEIGGTLVPNGQSNHMSRKHWVSKEKKTMVVTKCHLTIFNYILVL